MADLNFFEKQQIENFFGMKSGYVLDFSNRTFQEFVSSIIGKDIFEGKYNFNGDSKANRLRAFIKIESNYDVGILIENLIKYSMSKYNVGDSIDNETFDLYKTCSKIASNLKADGIVEHIDTLKPINDEKDFKLLTKAIRDSIDQNEPEVALDRLHTFLVKFIRELCNTHGIHFDKEESLNAVFGKYVKFLVDNNLIDSIMSEKILKYSINVIEAFNDIRNNKSLAHDNPILNYEESILIFNNVTNSVKFIRTVEDKTTAEKNDSVVFNVDDFNF